MVNHCHIVSVFLTYLFEFPQGRIVPEEVLGLSEDSQTEFFPGALGTISCTTVTVRLSVLSNYPLRTPGETICDSVCLPLDVPNVVVIGHEVSLYSEESIVVNVCYVSSLILL